MITPVGMHMHAWADQGQNQSCLAWVAGFLFTSCPCDPASSVNEKCIAMADTGVWVKCFMLHVSQF